MAIVTSLVVAAAVVMFAYLYASGTAPPSINTIVAWVVVTFQRGLNALSRLLGQSPLYPAVRGIGSAAVPVAQGAAGGLAAGARDVEDLLLSAERAVAGSVTPGAGIGGVSPHIGDGGLSAAVDSGLGFCYVGRNGSDRVCAPVSRHSGCMSGEYYPSREECRLNSRRA